jgi:hypothetical protein
MVVASKTKSTRILPRPPFNKKPQTKQVIKTFVFDVLFGMHVPWLARLIKEYKTAPSDMQVLAQTKKPKTSSPEKESPSPRSSSTKDSPSPRVSPAKEPGHSDLVHIVSTLGP